MLWNHINRFDFLPISLNGVSLSHYLLERRRKKKANVVGDYRVKGKRERQSIKRIQRRRIDFIELQERIGDRALISKLAGL